jgi:hypothetical protein
MVSQLAFVALVLEFFEKWPPSLRAI